MIIISKNKKMKKICTSKCDFELMRALTAGRAGHRHVTCRHHPPHPPPAPHHRDRAPLYRTGTGTGHGSRRCRCRAPRWLLACANCQSRSHTCTCYTHADYVIAIAGVRGHGRHRTNGALPKRPRALRTMLDPRPRPMPMSARRRTSRRFSVIENEHHIPNPKIPARRAEPEQRCERGARSPLNDGRSRHAHEYTR
jgi:hypothetical protein